MHKYKVTNILEDGTRLDSMEGVVLPKELSAKIIHLILTERKKEECSDAFELNDKDISTILDNKPKWNINSTLL